jgi:hypothetical protein
MTILRVANTCLPRLKKYDRIFVVFGSVNFRVAKSKF